MIEGLGGLDHVVVLVRNLDRSRDSWAALGFTISPRGVHSPHRGTANHTIMFGPDYLELLGVLAPTEHNAPSRARLQKREGIERTGFRAIDAEVAAEDLRRRGIEVTDPQDFSRPVDLPDGGRSEVCFRTLYWPLDRAPAGMRIFAIQHLTPEMVWNPALQRHANTARRILRVEVLATKPEKAAAKLSDLVGAESATEPDSACRVETAPDRAAIVYLGRETAHRRYPASWLRQFEEEGGIAITLEVGDLGIAARETGCVISKIGDRVSVPPDRTSGVILNFVACSSTGTESPA